MAIEWQGVIETSSGNLLRVGYQNFVAGAGETLVTKSGDSLPFPAFIYGDSQNTQFHRLTAPSTWALVNTPNSIESKAQFEATKQYQHTTLTHSGGQLTKVEYFEDSAKTIKVYTKDLTYTGAQLTSVLLTRESDSETFTRTLTYSGDDLVGVAHS